MWRGGCQQSDGSEVLTAREPAFEALELECVGLVLLGGALDLRWRGDDDDARASSGGLSRDGERRLQVPAGASGCEQRCLAAQR